ncbi:MAG: hypothetical protein M3468_00210, partial [Acidobacteriota bacterium]|nr:hypothetical protein [Acidobacteriota bacterium]
MQRRSVIVRPLVISLTAVALAAGLGAQSASKADADYVRKAYETYRSMKQASPYRQNEWQYLGPKDISGRATDIAVAE